MAPHVALQPTTPPTFWPGPLTSGIEAAALCCVLSRAIRVRAVGFVMTRVSPTFAGTDNFFRGRASERVLRTCLV